MLLTTESLEASKAAGAKQSDQFHAPALTSVQGRHRRPRPSFRDCRRSRAVAMDHTGDVPDPLTQQFR